MITLFNFSAKNNFFSSPNRNELHQNSFNLPLLEGFISLRRILESIQKFNNSQSFFQQNGYKISFWNEGNCNGSKPVIEMINASCTFNRNCDLFCNSCASIQPFRSAKVRLISIFLFGF